MNRECYICRAPILECMGSVHAGSWLRAMAEPESVQPVFEMCPNCTTKTILTMGDGLDISLEAYPSPPGYTPTVTLS